MTRTIAMLVFEDAQGLDVSGPLEAFALARQQALDDAPGSAPIYALRLVSWRAGPLTLSSGITLLAEVALADVDASVDTLLVSGGRDAALARLCDDAALCATLAERAACVRRVGSVCSGALLLGAAGLLARREATTHWMDADELQRRNPSTRVVPDAIYIRDGHVWSSAGITAGMDMALAMVRDDHGPALALKVAKRMVMPMHRSGGQSQFSGQLAALALPDVFADLAAWMRANVEHTLDVETLAARVHLSARQFARRFNEAFGSAPQRYVELLRIDAAKPLLEHSRKDIKRIAIECGFGSEESMRRAFVRRLGVKPGEYRERFGLR